MTEDEIKAFFKCIDQEAYEKEKHRYENGLATYNKTFLYFQLIHIATDEIIGWCGYHTWYTDHDRAEIGYGFFNFDYEKKGLMTEAIERILAYGFKEMNLHRVEAFVSPDNPPSLALMTKNNFTKEGHLREHYINKGTPEDSLVFSLLKHEYFPKS
jgi:ribosomal-protein-alanine N-acetyltransferase